jgi:hypothetical protein
LTEQDVFSDWELELAAREYSPEFAGIVLAQAFSIVQHELRVSRAQLVKILGISYRAASFAVSGRPIRRETTYLGWMQKLEQVRREQCRYSTNVIPISA